MRLFNSWLIGVVRDWDDRRFELALISEESGDGTQRLSTALLTDERENGKSPFLPHFLSYMIFSRLQRQLYVRRHGGYKHIEDDGGLCGIRFVSDIRSYWSGPHQE